MEQLVNDKVEAFWKGIEGGANKRGQIILTFSEKRQKKSWFQVYIGEVRLSLYQVITFASQPNYNSTQEEIPWEQW
jgi:autophagy-related protein 101